MSILEKITDKIKSSLPGGSAKDVTQKPLDAKNNDLNEGTNAVLESILTEVTLIRNIVVGGMKQQAEKQPASPSTTAPGKPETLQEEQNAGKKQKASKKKQAKAVEVPSVEPAVPKKEDTKRKDGEKVRKEKPTAPKRKKKEKKEAPTTQKAQQPPAAAPIPAPAPEEPPVEEDDLLTSIIKFIFKGFLAVGGFIAFLNIMIGDVLGSIFGSGEDGFFGTMFKVFDGILSVVKTVYNIISPVLEFVGIAIKEGVLNIGQMWKEAKLELMSDSLVMVGIRKILGIKVSDEEREKLKKEVYEGRVRREERMKGYVERVTGKKTEVPVTKETKGKPPQPVAAGETEKTPPVVIPAPPPKPVEGAPPPPAPAPAPAAAATPAGAPPAAAPGAAPAATPVPTPAPAPTAAPIATPAPAGGESLASVVVKENDGVNINGLNPSFEKKLVAMATDFKEKTGKKMMVTSGVRTPEKQKELWDAKLKATGGNVAETRKWVAEPPPPYGKGKGSSHMSGLAVDFNARGPAGINVLAGPRSSPTGWLEKFGLTRNVPGEDWHVQAVSVPPSPDNPTNPGAPIAVPGKDGSPVNVASGKEVSKPKDTQPVNAAPATGQSLNQASAEVGSEKADRSRQPNVNVTYVDQTKVSSVAKTNYN